MGRPPTQPSQRISDNQAVGWQPAACPPDAPHRPAARGHGVGDHLVQAVSHWAQQAGAVRPDVQPLDLLRLSHGVAAATARADDAEQAERLLSLMLNGVFTDPAGGSRTGY